MPKASQHNILVESAGTPMRATSHLVCRFLGSFQVSLDGKAVTGFESDKVRALLAYLAIEAGRPHRREALSALLWPDQPAQAAGQSLRQAIYLLRRTLSDAGRSGLDGQDGPGKEAGPGGRPLPDEALADASPPPYLLVGRGTVQFNPVSSFEMDVAAFKELVAWCERHQHGNEGPCHGCAQCLREAVELYRGELLKGFSTTNSREFEEWLLFEREVLHRQVMRALEFLAAYCEENGHEEQALGYVLRQLNLEPWRESAHLQAMRLLVRTGQRAAALARFEACKRILNDELGVEPSREITALYERICDGSEPVVRGRAIVSGGQPAASNFPGPLTSFVGREAEVTAIAEMLLRPNVRQVVITGPGGVGKTRIALQVANSLLPRFQDGVLFVDLSTVDRVDGVISAIVNQLGLKDGAGEQPISNVQAHLKHGETLLLLDNFEQVAGAASLVAQLVRATEHLKVLVTSRVALPLRSAYEFPVPPMSVPEPGPLPHLEQLAEFEAVRLFTERAVARNPNFRLTLNEARCIVEICRRLDGLPLAIELAAGRIRVLSPQAMLARLQGRLALLGSTDADVPARQRTMRATIDWSYDLLSPQEQTLFRRLGVFSGGWTLQAAEAVVGQVGDAGSKSDTEGLHAGLCERLDVLHALEGLVDENLVRQSISPDDAGDEPRYIMLETIKEYSVERLMESREQEALYLQHARYYLAYAEETLELAKSDELASFHKLELEYSNLQAALTWLVAQESAHAEQMAARLAQAFRRLWDVRGHWSEGRRLLNQVMAHPQWHALPAKLRSRLLNSAGWLASRQGDLDMSTRYLRESLALSEALGDIEAVASALNQLGSFALYRGDYKGAASLFEQALARTGGIETGGPHSRAFMANLATTLLFQGDYEQAGALARLVLAPEGDVWGKGTDGQAPSWDYTQACGTLGVSLLMRGEPESAGAFFNRGLEGARRGGYALMMLYCLCGCAAVLGLAGDKASGARLFGAYEANSSKLGWPMPPGFRNLYERLVASTSDQSDPQEWEQAYAEGRSLTLEEAAEYALSRYVPLVREQAVGGRRGFWA